MGHTRLPKEVLIPGWARQNVKVTKGPSMFHNGAFLIVVNNVGTTNGIMMYSWH